MPNLIMKNKSALIISFGLSAILYTVVPNAFSAEEKQKTKQTLECNDDGCKTQQGLVFRVKSKGEDEAKKSSADEKNRRVDVEYRDIYTYDEAGFTPDKKRAEITGNLLVHLENGGLLWATEDPALTQPVLGINAASLAVFEDGEISEPVNVSYYTNYAAFIERMEFSVYLASDTDLVTPLVTEQLPVASNGRYSWSGQMALDQKLIQGDELIYVVRAFDKDGRFDETNIKTMRLVSSEEKKSNLSRLTSSVSPEISSSISEQELANQLIESATFGSNDLRQQNIPIYGSRVRVFGQDIPKNHQVRINGNNVQVDLERKFIAEYLLPVGMHTLNVDMGISDQFITKQLTVNVTGRYMFMVALADITISQNSVADSIEAVDEGDQFEDDLLLEGRLAFYLKGKVRGKYLITAQADTRERELEDLFQGFLDKDPQDVFRRLDPDRYYPVYGDDSNVYRDVDTQGKFYVRVDWDKSQALWGNYNTGITGSEFAQYSRSLYGAAINWRSIETTELGEAKTQLKGFASEAQTALGHVEFLGTGGSLYYLRDTDILPGSDKVVLEVRDRTTGRVETKVDLLRGADYEIDEIQGRIILNRPLAQISRQNIGTIIRDQPLDGLDNILLVDYEYLPSGFAADNATLGGRAKVWLNDNIAVGGTFVDENRDGDDYELSALDITLQAGRGTFVKLENAQTKSNQAGSYFSDNGGFSFTEITPEPSVVNPNKKGDAYAIEARANFKELGWTRKEINAGAWHRETEAGFSIARRTPGEETTETGVEFSGEIYKDITISGRVSEFERGTDNSLEQAQVNVAYKLAQNSEITAELRSIDETIAGVETSAQLGAVRYSQRFFDTWDLYGVSQFTIENDGGTYDNNDLVTLGSRYVFGDRSSLGAEYSSGHRGDSANLNAEYQINNGHSLYGNYSYSTDTTDSVFGRNISDGITLGQRWRVSNQVTIYNESQQLKDPQTTGLSHTFGLDYVPSTGWNLGFSLQDGELESSLGLVDRQAVSVSGAYRSSIMDWSTKLEFREDSGAEQREQFLTTNRLSYKINQDWRLAARVNYSESEDASNPTLDARFTEANLGFAYRPVNNQKWALLGKYTYLYDLRSAEQVTNGTDQRSNILSFEALYRLNPDWELAGKFARRKGEIRDGRGQGAWFASTTDFYALQTRYHLVKDWDALFEYRVLSTKENDDQRDGWLLGADYHINDNFKVGAGYNFTSFSENLANLDFDYDGWFINFVGKY